MFDTADHAYAPWRETNREARTPDYFVEAGNITPADQLRMHSSLQRFVDAAISNTVALAPEAALFDVAGLYNDADALSLKGCTLYRRQSRTDIVGACETTAADEGAIGIQHR